jgi:uracil-DNA glycosylase
MALAFDPGYCDQRYAELVSACPGAEVFPPQDFRVEWGPVFHRGRLDGTARVLVVGQDPAAHEAICRRILVGEAGQRAQGLLARLGITRSYVMVNAFPYSVFGQGGGARHVADPGVVAYRHAWFDLLAERNDLEAIISLGQLADTAVTTWLQTPAGKACRATYVTVRHPTYPESASASGSMTKAEAMRRLVESWDAALDTLHPVLTPDEPTPLRHFGPTVENDVEPIPAYDLPAGLPAWMAAKEAWAARTGRTAQEKRATITVTVPTGARGWPPLT